MIDARKRCGTTINPVPCACVTCRGRYDLSELSECEVCGDRHVCPHCGEDSRDATVFIGDEPTVITNPWLARHLRATVWGRPN